MLEIYADKYLLSPILSYFLLLSVQNFGGEFFGWVFLQQFFKATHLFTLQFAGGLIGRQHLQVFKLYLKGDPDFIICALTGYGS